MGGSPAPVLPRPLRPVPTLQNGSLSGSANGESAGPTRVPDSPFPFPIRYPEEFACTVAGKPRTWRRTLPATVTVDPASGTCPTGDLLVNVVDGL